MDDKATVLGPLQLTPSPGLMAENGLIDKGTLGTYITLLHCIHLSSKRYKITTVLHNEETTLDCNTLHTQIIVTLL